MRGTNERASYWFDEDLKGNFSLNKRDTFNPNDGYIGVRLLQGVPLLDRDWNELEDIRRYQEMIFRKEYIGNCTPDNGFLIVGQGLANDFVITKGRYLVDGFDVYNSNDIRYSVQTDLDQNNVPIAVPKLSAPTDTARTDSVYLEVRVREVGMEFDDNLRNPNDVGTQTSVRHKLLWVVKVNPGGQMPASTESVHRVLLAIMTRPANQSAINASDIDDKRLKLQKTAFEENMFNVAGSLTVASDLTVGGNIRATGASSIIDAPMLRFGERMQTGLPGQSAIISRIEPILIQSDYNTASNMLVKKGASNLLPSGTPSSGMYLTILNVADHSRVSSTRYDTANVAAAQSGLATALSNMDSSKIGIITTFGKWVPTSSTVWATLAAAFRRVGLIKAANIPVGANDSGTIGPYAAIFRPGNSGLSQVKAEEIGMSKSTTGAIYIPAEIRGWLIDGSYVVSAQAPNFLARAGGIGTALEADADGSVIRRNASNEQVLKIHDSGLTVSKATSLEGQVQIGSSWSSSITEKLYVTGSARITAGLTVGGGLTADIATVNGNLNLNNGNLKVTYTGETGAALEFTSAGLTLRKVAGFKEQVQIGYWNSDLNEKLVVHGDARIGGSIKGNLKVLDSDLQVNYTNAEDKAESILTANVYGLTVYKATGLKGQVQIGSWDNYKTEDLVVNGNGRITEGLNVSGGLTTDNVNGNLNVNNGNLKVTYTGETENALEFTSAGLTLRKIAGFVKQVQIGYWNSDLNEILVVHGDARIGGSIKGNLKVLDSDLQVNYTNAEDKAESILTANVYGLTVYKATGLVGQVQIGSWDKYKTEDLVVNGDARIAEGLSVSGALTVDGFATFNNDVKIGPNHMLIIRRDDSANTSHLAFQHVGKNTIEFIPITYNKPGTTGLPAIRIGDDSLYNYGVILNDGSYLTVSDRSLKTNISIIPDTLKKLDRIRGVSFDWINDLNANSSGTDRKRNIGLIAQEVQLVFPELVSRIYSEDKEILALNYSNFTAVLVQAVKELKSLNQALSDRVMSLEASTMQ